MPCAKQKPPEGKPPRRSTRAELEAQLERYIAAGYANEGDDLIAWQAFPWRTSTT